MGEGGRLRCRWMPPTGATWTVPFLASPLSPGTSSSFRSSGTCAAGRPQGWSSKRSTLWAAEWLITAYRPRVILLIRHPAAIALSYRRLGWGWDRLDLARFGPYLDTILRPWRTLLERAQGFWEWHGVLQGAALRVAKEALDAWQDHRVVRYEDLCEAPLRRFRDLYAFGGLSWSSRIEAVVEGKSSEGDRDDPYQTTRPSREMAFAWRGHVGQADLEQLRAAYTAFNLPWYATSDDW